MKFLRNLLHIPSPVELGKSEHNALPSDWFPNETEDGEEEYTWEKYDAEMSVRYPVKWFLTRTVPTFWRRYIWGTYAPIERARYWLVSHLVPSRRYHMLDLRQPKPDLYQYGWIDAPAQILYANFAILKNYVEGELEGKIPEPQDESEWEGAALWNEHYKEIESLYRYWMVERPIWQKKLNNMSHMASVVRNDQRNFREGEKLYEQLRAEQDKFDEFETEALIRLIRTRGRMWT